MAETTRGRREQAADGDRRGAEPGSQRDETVAETEVEETFRISVDEGRRRMSRRLGPLLATGFVGGVDVGTGVLALLVVEHATGSKLLGGLAFSIGFIALALARSELFTEDFLVPVSAVIARQAKFRMLLRLWIGTAVTNLAGGWLFVWLVMRGFPEMGDTAIKAGEHYVGLGLGLRAFSLAVIGGVVITLMTWMQRHGRDSVAVRVIPAVTGAFVLAAAQLNHAIVNSLLMFSALHTGRAPFGYLQWAQAAGWAVLGNMVGGIGLVTLLRQAQVTDAVRSERENPAEGVPTRSRRRPR